MAAVVANLVVVSVAVTCRARHLAARLPKGSDGAGHQPVLGRWG
jgi:hypothetical protein